MSFREKARLAWQRICQERLQHWIGVLTALLIGVLVSHQLKHEPSWQRVRYFGHRFVERLPNDRENAGRTVVIMIDEMEYGSMLNGISPIDRSYLAKLVMAVRDAAPHVIALDIALIRPPTGDPFGDETLKLHQAIASVPDTTKVVLGFRVTGGPTAYIRERGLFDGISRSNVTFGCVTLTQDRTRLGLLVPLDTGEHDTFATAIARAVDPEAVRSREKKAREFSLVTTFLPRDAVPIVRAADVRARRTEEMAKLAHKIVIISGNWQDSATGKPVDQHQTPFGVSSGGVLNANYVEALLAPGATKKPVSGVFNVVVEIIATLGVALIFVVFHRSWSRGLVLFALASLIVVTSVIIYQNFGGAFDASIVLVFLGIHALIERREASKSRAFRKWSFGLTLSSCVVAAFLVYWQSRRPTPVYNPDDVAWVAKLEIVPIVKELGVIQLPQVITPGVRLASLPPPSVLPTNKSLIAPRSEAKVPLVSRGDLMHLAEKAPGVVPPTAQPKTPSVPLETIGIKVFSPPAVAEEQFRLAMERRRNVLSPTLPEPQSPTNAAEQPIVTAYSTLPTSAEASFTDETDLGGSKADAAHKAFDDAWRESSVNDYHLPMVRSADNKPIFSRPRHQPQPKPVGGDFELMFARLGQTASVLGPERESFVVTMTLTDELFASDGTISGNVLKALAQVSVELMDDKDLTVTLVADPRDERAMAHRNALASILREMHVEARRIALSDAEGLRPGELKFKVWL